MAMFKEHDNLKPSTEDSTENIHLVIDNYSISNSHLQTWLLNIIHIILHTIQNTLCTAKKVSLIFCFKNI